MRLRPFVPHDPIDDIDDDAKKHYSDPDATDDQTISNENLPAPDILTPAENTTEIDTNEFESVDREHGTIYYEREQMHEVPPLPNALPEIVHPDKQPDMTDVQHGIISYEQEQMYEVPPIPETLRDTVHTNNTEQAEPESLPEEMNYQI